MVSFTCDVTRWTLFRKPERLQVLLVVLHSLDEQMIVTITQERIRSITGLSQCTLYACLKDLCADGIVELDGQSIRVARLPEWVKTDIGPVREQSVVKEEAAKAEEPAQQVTVVAHKEGESVRARAPRFAKPSIQELAEYIELKGYTFSASDFFDYYESVGWVVGRTRKPMKSWKAACSTFQKNENRDSHRNAYTAGREDARNFYIASEAGVNVGQPGACQGGLEGGAGNQAVLPTHQGDGSSVDEVFPLL